MQSFRECLMDLLFEPNLKIERIDNLPWSKECDNTFSKRCTVEREFTIDNRFLGCYPEYGFIEGNRLDVSK